MRANQFPALVVLGVLVYANAYAQPRGERNGSMPVVLTPVAATVSSSAVSIDESFTCRGGGTRVTKASYTPATGALASSVTFTACVERNSTQDGSITTTGTLLPGSAANLYTLSLTTTVDMDRTNGTDSIGRLCTRTTSGTFDLTAQTFSGTVTQNNCIEDVLATQSGDIVQQLLHDSIQTER
jgi:hypothetical protein